MTRSFLGCGGISPSGLSTTLTPEEIFETKRAAVAIMSGLLAVEPGPAVAGGSFLASMEGSDEAGLGEERLLQSYW